MDSICDFLATADLCVEDVSLGTDDLVGGLGIPQPHEAGRESYPDEGWDVLFALVSKPFATAPTRLELLAPLDKRGSDTQRPARQIVDGQGSRGIFSHATVIATPKLDFLIDRLQTRGITHWVQPAEENAVPFPRLWMGISDENLARYDSSVDLGMRLEFIPSGTAVIPEKLFKRPNDLARPGATGFRRIIARDFVVENIDYALQQLEEAYDWRAGSAVRREDERGYAFVSMARNCEHGAALRLVERTVHQSSDLLNFCDRTGAGRITLAAYDLEAMADALVTRGIPFIRLAKGEYEPEAIIPHLPHLADAIMIVPDVPLL